MYLRIINFHAQIMHTLHQFFSSPLILLASKTAWSRTSQLLYPRPFLMHSSAFIAKFTSACHFIFSEHAWNREKVPATFHLLKKERRGQWNYGTVW